MDNNFFNNDCYGSEPQRPFTEKSSQPPVQAENESQTQHEQNQSFTPQPYEQYAARRAAPEPTTNPQPETKFDFQPPYEQTPYNGYQQSNPNNNDYSQACYTNPNINRNFQSSANYSDFSQSSQQYGRHLSENNTPSYQPYSQNNFNHQKKSANTGLIVVIIVLSVLLIGSLVSLFAYILYNSTAQSSQKSYSHSFTLPDSTTPQTEETTPQEQHKESDYSDKIVPDYSGLSLEEKPKDASSNSEYTAEYAYNKVCDSVVGVVCYSDEISNVEDADSQGSGIIISSNGYVVTNAHVIGNSKTAYIIQVVTANGDTYNAGVVGFDTRTDLAVLKMDDAKNLTSATFGNSDQIALGEDIIAVGNPGGLDYQNSITRGIVSAVNRELSSSSIVKYIQTDAAINPGNSGGPIVNLYGQVVGIASAKIVSEQYEGMGFAIPSTTVKDIIDSLIRNGYVAGRVKIGISGVAIDATTAMEQDIPQGILVQEIVENGPCDGSGLKSEDSIIIEADGKTVSTFSDIYNILENCKEGDKLELKYYSISSGKEETTTVTLQADK